MGRTLPVFRKPEMQVGSSRSCFLECFKIVLVQARFMFCFGSLLSVLPSSWGVLFLLLAGQCLHLTHEFGDSSFYSIVGSLNQDLRKHRQEASKGEFFKPVKAATLLSLVNTARNILCEYTVKDIVT